MYTYGNTETYNYYIGFPLPHKRKLLGLRPQNMLKTPKIVGVIVVTNESVGLHVQNLRPG